MFFFLLVLCSFAADEYTLEPIVVTARKVDSDIRDVPMSLSVINGESIDQSNVFQLEDLSDKVPNLSLRQQQAEVLQRTTIRGVGTYSRNIGFDTRAAVYLDGIYLGQSPALNTELYDLERVEVLRGPQGTLYGKNTVAGAINLISKKPDLDSKCETTLSAGNLNYKKALIKTNLPIIKNKLNARLSLLHLDRDGFYKNIAEGDDLDNENTNAFRFTLTESPEDNTMITVSADGSFSDRDITCGDPLTDTFAISRDTAAPGDFDVSYNITPEEKRDLWGMVATLEHELKSGFLVTAISGFRNTQVEFQNDLDYSAADLMRLYFDDKYKQFSQEVHIRSPRKNKLEYLAGLYYFAQDAQTYRTAIFGEDIELLGDPRMVSGNDVPNSGDVDTRSYAVFVNGKYHLTDKLSLESGCRYTYETKKADFFLDGSQSGFFNIAVWNFRDTYSDGVFTPSAGITYDISDGLTGYAIVSTGFKSGGFNLDWLTTAEVNAGVEYDKETVVNYETGLKLFLPGYHLRTNLALFCSRYRDYQVQQFIDLGGGATAMSITNAAKVTTKGAELEVVCKPTAKWSVNTGISLLDAEFDKFPGGGLAGSDASGNKLPFAPDFTAGLGFEYKTPVCFFPATLKVQGNYFYTDSYYSHESNVKAQPLAGGGSVPFCYTDSYSLLSGRVSLDSDTNRWSLFLWGDNLLNEDYVTDSHRDFLGTIVALRGIPRTFGAGVTFWL